MRLYRISNILLLNKDKFFASNKKIKNKKKCGKFIAGISTLLLSLLNVDGRLFHESTEPFFFFGKCQEIKKGISGDINR